MFTKILMNKFILIFKIIYDLHIIFIFYLIFKKRKNSFIYLSDRFGQTISTLNNLYNLKENNYLKKYRIFIIKYNSNLYNNYLIKKYKKYFIFINISSFLIFNKFFNIKNNTEIKNIFHHEYSIINLNKKTSIPVKFSKTEKEKFKKFMKLFPKDNNGIICFSLKDKDYYLDKYFYNDKNWPEHYFGDINKYVKAIEYFIKNKFIVVRVGKITTKKINIESKYYFDYSKSEYQSDVYDILIAGNCNFFFSNGTGYDRLGEIFKKPIFHCGIRNYLSIHNYFPDQIWLPYNYYSEKIKKNLTFKEIFDLEKQTNLNNIWSFFDKNNIKIIKHNEDEILLFAKECLRFISKNLILNNKEKEFQKKFWSLYNSYDFHSVGYNNNYEDIDLLISPNFLMNNSWMLE